ncbi:hypothetical protein TNCV_309301 [Trichonephila clavipes]|nr:hypothetical protein TNCV_309301 [Trichonephila clavipes]
MKLSSAHLFEWYKKFSGGRVSVEDDEPAGRPRSAITDQSVTKFRHMNGLPLTSVAKLSINTTTLNLYTVPSINLNDPTSISWVDANLSNPKWCYGLSRVEWYPP